MEYIVLDRFDAKLLVCPATCIMNMGGLTSTIVKVYLHFTLYIIKSNFTKIHVAFGRTANCASKIKCKRTASKPTELIFNESIQDCWLNEIYFKFHCCRFHSAVVLYIRGTVQVYILLMEKHLCKTVIHTNINTLHAFFTFIVCTVH